MNICSNSIKFNYSRAYFVRYVHEKLTLAPHTHAPDLTKKNLVDSPWYLCSLFVPHIVEAKSCFFFFSLVSLFFVLRLRKIKTLHYHHPEVVKKSRENLCCSLSSHHRKLLSAHSRANSWILCKKNIKNNVTFLCGKLFVANHVHISSFICLWNGKKSFDSRKNGEVIFSMLGSKIGCQVKSIRCKDVRFVLVWKRSWESRKNNRNECRRCIRWWQSWWCIRFDYICATATSYITGTLLGLYTFVHFKYAKKQMKGLNEDYWWLVVEGNKKNECGERLVRILQVHVLFFGMCTC